MAARLLWVSALIATITTGSMAFQCYERMNGTTTTKKVSCPSGWCAKGTLKTGTAMYRCDPVGACALVGDTCMDIPTDKDIMTTCCCNGNLCNSATLYTQHTWLGLISFIVTMMLLA
uniref:Uncharacterized protein n=1 Tax=Plectus sambesii TaxID=2011161 RepID=A0A914WQP4_9BILA